MVATAASLYPQHPFSNAASPACSPIQPTVTPLSAAPEILPPTSFKACPFTCPNSELFCPGVNACGPLHACPTKCKVKSAMKHVDDSDCTEEGFFLYPGVCKKFRCCAWNPVGERFTEYIFDCAPGTDLWCQSLLTCTYAFQCPETCDGDGDRGNGN